MTLTTTVVFDRPVDVPTLWLFVRELIMAGRVPTEEGMDSSGVRTLTTPRDSGLAARAHLSYRPEGPFHVWDPDEPTSRQVPFDNLAAVVLEFDSEGRAARSVHAWLVCRVGDFADEAGVWWAWHDEDSDTWHEDSFLVAVVLGDPLEGGRVLAVRR